MFGKRRMLLVAIGALALGSLVTALSDNIAVLIVGRAMQGVSAAAIPLGISLLSTAMPREKVGSSIALVSAMLGIGGALGLPLAGFVAEHADFHLLFWINAAMGAVAFFGILLAVPEPPARSGGRLDWTGSVLLAAGLVSLLLPLSQGGDWGWTDLKTITLLGAAVVILAVFGWTQRGSVSRWSTSRRCGRDRSCWSTWPRSASASPCSPPSSAARPTSNRQPPAATGSAPACSSEASSCCPAASRCCYWPRSRPHSSPDAEPPKPSRSAPW
jgi:MFS family permease